LATHHDRTTSSEPDPPLQTSLQIELKAPDRQAVTTFRDTFLRWLNEGSGPVSHVLGTPDRLSLDEVPAPPNADGLPTLRVNVSWNRDANARSADARMLSMLPDEAEPPPAPASVASADNFGVFPDEYQDSPLRHIPIAPAVRLPAPLRVGGRAREEQRPSLVQRMGTTAYARWTAARKVAAQLKLPQLTVRIPSPSDVSGMRSFVTLATAAAVIGFMVGTLF